MTKDPDTLSEKERNFQANTFMKIFSNAIQGVDERFKFKTINIEDLFNGGK